MSKNQFYLVLFIAALTLAGMIGIYYMLGRALQLYQQKQQQFKADPLGSVLGLIKG